MLAAGIRASNVANVLSKHLPVSELVHCNVPFEFDFEI